MKSFAKVPDAVCTPGCEFQCAVARTPYCHCQCGGRNHGKHPELRALREGAWVGPQDARNAVAEARAKRAMSTV